MARPSYESSSGLFTTRDDVKTLLALCDKGRLDLRSIVDEIHSPEECEEVFLRLATDGDFPTVVQFDWEKLQQ